MGLRLRSSTVVAYVDQGSMQERQLASKLLFFSPTSRNTVASLASNLLSSLQQRQAPPSPLPGQQPAPTLLYKLELILPHARIPADDSEELTRILNPSHPETYWQAEGERP
jgi:hypothetical protein